MNETLEICQKCSVKDRCNRTCIFAELEQKEKEEIKKTNNGNSNNE